MGKVFKTTSIVGAGIVAAVAIVAFWNWEKIDRLQATLTLFDADKIVYNFSHMDDAFEAVPFERSGPVFTFAKTVKPLPEAFIFKDKETPTRAFLTRRATTALLVIKDDTITFEEYLLGTKDTDRRISWSVNKSVVSALFGPLVESGAIDIEKSVSDYVPMLKNSGYDGVRVKDVLQMSSGVAWDEDYSKFDSDINKMGRALALGGSLDELAANVKKGWEPGKKLFYVSMDTHVLSMVLRAVTGKPMQQLLEETLWSKIGVEDGGFWLTDGHGAAFALGGLNIRTRDYARFGRLFLNNGNWNGEQVIPESWILASTTADGDHVTPGPEKFGYGFQWWLGPDARPREFIAIGVYGQYIYVNQPEKVIIVKNSADRGFMDNIGSMSESIAFFRAVTDSLSESAAPTP